MLQVIIDATQGEINNSTILKFLVASRQRVPLFRVDHPVPIGLIQMNLHEIPAFTQNFSIKLTCCVPEPEMMLCVRTN